MRPGSPAFLCAAGLFTGMAAWRAGTGRIVQDEALQERALGALQRKYGWQLSVAMLVYRLRGLYRDR